MNSNVSFGNDTYCHCNTYLFFLLYPIDIKEKSFELVVSIVWDFETIHTEIVYTYLSPDTKILLACQNDNKLVILFRIST